MTRRRSPPSPAEPAVVELVRQLGGLLTELGLGELEVAIGETRIRLTRPAPAAGSASSAALGASASAEHAAQTAPSGMATVAPSAGCVTAWVPPGGFGVRVDSHLMAPYAVPPFYDSLIAKVIAHGRDRAEAIARMRRALMETVIEGVKTTIPFQLKVLGDSAFVEGRFTGADGVRLLADGVPAHGVSPR